MDEPAIVGDSTVASVIDSPASTSTTTDYSTLLDLSNAEYWVKSLLAELDESAISDDSTAHTATNGFASTSSTTDCSTSEPTITDDLDSEHSDIELWVNALLTEELPSQEPVTDDSTAHLSNSASTLDATSSSESSLFYDSNPYSLFLEALNKR